MIKKILHAALLSAAGLIISCADPVQTQTPTLECSITNPADSAFINQGDSLIITAKAVSSDNSLQEMVIKLGNDTLAVTSSAQKTVVWHTIKDVDGDFRYETGEPFVDWERFSFDHNGNMSYGKNNTHDHHTTTVFFDKSFFKSKFPGRSIGEFLGEANFNGTVIKVTCDSISSPNEYKIDYPREPFVDLPSSYGNQTQLSLRYNFAYDSSSTAQIFDEYEAYTRPIRPDEISQIGTFSLNGNYVKYVGTYTVYHGLKRELLLNQNVNWSQIVPDNYSTWQDLNGNGKYDLPDGIIEVAGTPKGKYKISVIAKDKNSNVKTVTKNIFVQ